jgi:hypothetical protein
LGSYPAAIPKFEQAFVGRCEDPRVCQARIVQGTGRIEHLKQCRRAFLIGTERDLARFLGAAEKGLLQRSHPRTKALGDLILSLTSLAIARSIHFVSSSAARCSLVARWISPDCDQTAARRN